jgi:hypothetical protein
MARLIIALALLAAPAAAQTPFRPDLAAVCAAAPGRLPADWRISAAVWPSRLTCLPGGEGLRIAVHPGDAAEQSPGDAPSERAEIQVRREMVRFDTPVWYSFRFRLAAPWQGIGNRTVIHQVKQNIAAGDELPRGICPAANPLLKVEAGATETGAAFVVKTRGTADCRDGASGITVCGPWKLEIGRWHTVHIALRASQQEGQSDLRLWLDGRACPHLTGRLGYADHGARDAQGRPVVDAQPRFGIYRDALADNIQALDFADIAFWHASPAGDPAWQGIALAGD